MKTYGLRRAEVWSDDLIVGRLRSGQQSRKVANIRKKDKKILHRRERRTLGKRFEL